MAMDDIVQEPIKVMLDKERAVLYKNRGFRALVSTYGNMRAAIEAMQAITPKIKAHKGEALENGTLAESDIYADIAQDEAFYDTLIAWLHAGLIAEDKTLTVDQVSDLIDEMDIMSFVNIRIAIWRAFAASVPTAALDADPTTPTT
jgi:hypothetical protein